MKRSLIESRLKSTPQIIKSKIEGSPLVSFMIGFLLGIILASFYDILIPAVLIAAVVILVAWFMGESEDDLFAGDLERDSAPGTEGQSSRVNGGRSTSGE